MNLYLEVNSSDLIDDAKKLSLELNLQLIESQEKNNEDYFFYRLRILIYQVGVKEPYSLAPWSPFFLKGY